MASVLKAIVTFWAAGLAIFNNIALGSGQIESSKCSENATSPDLRRAYQIWTQEDNDLMDPSIQLIPNIFERINQDRISDANRFNSVPAKHTLMFGHRKCSSTFSPRDNSLMERSTCPWYVELNFDENRYPPFLATVKCRCSKCYDLTKPQPKREENNKKNNKKNRRKISGSKCQEISYMQKVLKQSFGPGGTKQCTNDVFDYVQTYEKISVGCTCTKPKNDILAQGKTYPQQ